MRYFCEKEKFFEYEYIDEKCTNIKKVTINFLYCKKSIFRSEFSYEKAICKHIELEEGADIT